MKTSDENSAKKYMLGYGYTDPSLDIWDTDRYYHWVTVDLGLFLQSSRTGASPSDGFVLVYSTAPANWADIF